MELLANYSPSGRQGGSYGPGGDFGDVLVDGGAADAEQPGDGRDGIVRPGQQVTGVADLLGCHGRRPPQAHTTGAGGIQSLAGALDDQLADELRQRGEDMEHQPPAGGGGVQRLMQALEADSLPAQPGDDLDQVGQRPGQPVQARHDQGVARLIDTPALDLRPVSLTSRHAPGTGLKLDNQAPRPSGGALGT